MKRLHQIFNISLPKIFFVANIIVCAVVFDWKEFSEYLEMPMRVNCHFKPYSGGGIDICGYGGASILDLILLLVIAIFLILTLPSMAITEITLGMLKTSFPFWCYETHQIIYIPVFAVINSFYWVSLAHIIELGYFKYRQLYPPKKKYLGIFKNF